MVQAEAGQLVLYLQHPERGSGRFRDSRIRKHHTTDWTVFLHWPDPVDELREQHLARTQALARSVDPSDPFGLDAFLQPQACHRMNNTCGRPRATWQRTGQALQSRASDPSTPGHAHHARCIQAGLCLPPIGAWKLADGTYVPHGFADTSLLVTCVMQRRAARWCSPTEHKQSRIPNSVPHPHESQVQTHNANACMIGMQPHLLCGVTTDATGTCRTTHRHELTPRNTPTTQGSIVSFR